MEKKKAMKKKRRKNRRKKPIKKRCKTRCNKNKLEKKRRAKKRWKIYLMKKRTHDEKKDLRQKKGPATKKRTYEKTEAWVCCSHDRLVCVCVSRSNPVAVTVRRGLRWHRMENQVMYAYSFYMREYLPFTHNTQTQVPRNGRPAAPGSRRAHGSCKIDVNWWVESVE